MKKQPLPTTILLTILTALTYLSFTPSGSKPINNRQQLATKYYQTDLQWYLDNIPFFECSDKTIEEVYYYRWKLYKAHIRKVNPPYNYVVTEFISGWGSEPYSTTNAAAGYHIREGRWLKNHCFVDGYINYLYRENMAGGYSENIADGAYARYLVTADSAFITPLAGYMENTFNHWQSRYDQAKHLYSIEPIADASEYTIASIDAAGGKGGVIAKDSIGGYDGDFSQMRHGFFGGDAFRPTFNTYMYANALAISRIEALIGNLKLSSMWLEKAQDLRSHIISGLWSDSLSHFIDRHQRETPYIKYWEPIRGRELAGYAPWYFNLPDNSPKYNAAWSHLMDTTQFMGRYGLRTNEPSYQYYMKQIGHFGRYPACQWNGPSWPYQTTQAIGGAINLLNDYNQDIITSLDYVKLLRQYAFQHYDKGVLNLQQDYNPDTGKPIVVGMEGNHYNHSTFNDLVITGLCGIRPSEGNRLIIHPLIDNSIRYFCLDEVIYHGHKLTVVYDDDGSHYKLGKGLTVFVDGKKLPLKITGGKYEISVGKSIVEQSPKPRVNYALNIQKICNITRAYKPSTPIECKGYPVPSASVNSIPDSLYWPIDGRIWYFPENNMNNWTTLGSKLATDWYALDFGQIREISSVKLYLYADGIIYGAPDDYSIEYYNTKQWLPVKMNEQNPVKPIGNTVNTVVFDKVRATKIRIKLKHDNKKLAVAVAEVECY
jgi:hypothetical protein